MELSPEVEDEVDDVLVRLRTGERQGLHAQLHSLARHHPLHYAPPFGLGVYEVVVNSDPAAAMPHFQRSVEIYPYFTDGYFNLATCAIKQGDVRKAVESLRKVTELAKDSESTDRARKQLQELEEIVATHEHFTTLDDYIENQKVFDQALQALARKDFNGAVEGFLNALKTNPGHVQSHGNIGLAYAGMGRKALALEHLDKALALDPDYALARDNRAIVEKMEEGRPYDMPMVETKFYLDQIRSGNTPPPGPRKKRWSLWG